MNGQLAPGTTLVSQSACKYIVKSLLGAGGQGEVYEVESNGKRFALKWYYPTTATSDQKAILENLVLQGSPSKCFLWPQDMITPVHDRSFGYIMPLRPSNFHSIVELMKRKAEPSFRNLCIAAFNLAKGYQVLHAKGFCYRDISFGNVFFDPNNGSVLICDNDNVAANGIDCGVYGTPRFMAPEIIVGKAVPSRNTDQFSLAVLLFYMFMLGHPLEGRLEAEIKCMDLAAMNKLYGTNPVFVFDPINKTNRPVPGYHDNLILFWDLYPKSLKDLFIHSFTTGLFEPNKRITEKEWMRVLASMITGIINCEKCGAEVFYDEAKIPVFAGHTCWNCGATMNLPARIDLGKTSPILKIGDHLYSHNIFYDYDMDTIIGTVVRNPLNPNLCGIRNDSTETWIYIKKNGTQLPVPPGKSGSIVNDARFHFGNVIGTIII